MKLEEEITAGVFVDSVCLLCGAHAPPEQKLRTCCEAGRLEDLALQQANKEGQEEGNVCNREVLDSSAPDNSTTVRCTGIMVYRHPEDCYCHISPPCSACVENRPQCNECGELGE